MWVSLAPAFYGIRNFLTVQKEELSSFLETKKGSKEVPGGSVTPSVYSGTSPPYVLPYRRRLGGIERKIVMELMQTLRQLCALRGVSGEEDAVREGIRGMLGSDCTASVDPMGNLIVFKKGATPGKAKLMVSAHMDEVGFIITGIREDGTLRFSAVGGIISTAVLGRRVTVGPKGLPGVISAKPIHLQKGSERENLPEIDDMVIDIGAKDKATAEQQVTPGDTACFDEPFMPFGKGLIASRALDDRVGCAVMVELCLKPLPCDVWFTFVTCEEVGLRGAEAAAFSVAPEKAIVLEGTTASDLAGTPADEAVCRVGGGAVLSFMDRATIYDKEFLREAEEVARKKEIPCQRKLAVAGGNDAGVIHKSRGGVKTLAVSVPCRYIHTASCVASEEDILAVYRLAEALIEENA